VDQYIHSLIRLHGVVLNQLSTGANLPFILVNRALTEIYRAGWCKDKALILCREVFGSNIGQNIGYPEVFHFFPKFSQGSSEIQPLDENLFVPASLPVNQSSEHPTLQSPATESVVK
jgi:hypothetical protein